MKADSKKISFFMSSASRCTKGNFKVNHSAETGSRVFFRLPQVAHRYSVSRATIWRWIKSGTLPEPVKLSPSTVGFYSDQLAAFDTKARGTNVGDAN
jgi:predicted DNA-binding transcriptional regulator AlpA